MLGWGTTPILWKVSLAPVPREQSPENAALFEADAQGFIEFSAIRADRFNVGSYYYVDFTETE